MDFLKFAIAIELLVVSTCSRYQTILRRIQDPDSGSKTWTSLSYAVNYYCELLYIKQKGDFLLWRRYALYRVPSSFNFVL